MENKKFDIYWYDLNRVAQKKLLSAIFGAKPIVSVDIEDEISVEEVLECEDLDISDEKEEN